MSWTPSRADFDTYMLPVYSPVNMIPDRGEGSRVWDREGREFIDFAGGIAVSALGHGHPSLQDALKTQADKIWHLSNVYTNEPALKLAKWLVEHTFADKVFFCSSGGEANEAAFKLARRYGHDMFGEHKSKIISFRNSFHGRTYFTVSVGGQPKYSQGFGPAIEGIVHADFNDLDSVRALIDDDTCAIVVEPVQGEGGITSATPEFLHGLRELCDEYEALLVFDEVQCGAGRTGSLYTYMQYDVVPDILTTAKAIGGGFPLAAMITTDDVGKVFSMGAHGSTYGGNPLATAVGLAAMQTIAEPEVLDGIAERRALFEQHLAKLNERFNLFKEVRGKGLLVGVELTEPYHGRARDIMAAAIDEGLMMLVAGPDVLRFTPSLVISPEEINEGMIRLERALNRIAG
ncbi:Acetylornithine/succinyldiaminopimelate aminotransferase [Halomonadaceae bacterium LMG 33818]|uniref:aspartate aminotransferase family protein n=1 Tax=Cernens ardua TaxID=3402176 RepID=UPI003EDB749F